MTIKEKGPGIWNGFGGMEGIEVSKGKEEIV